MNFFLIIVVALALAMDAFAVSIGVSLRLEKITRPQTFRLAFCFGFFQFFMLLIGWFAGRNILRYIQAFDHWIAFGLLAFIGSKMIFESFKRTMTPAERNPDPTKGLSLFFLSVATSIDALAVGLSFAVLHVKIIYPAIIIGLVASLITILGVKIGPILGQLVGKRAELLGGSILIFIGVKILFEHL
jgi:putative Mn2+ efflux pump MntP